MEEKDRSWIPRSLLRGGFILNKLVFFESSTDIYAAIAREKEIKGWKRKKKNALIATMNPNWNDLADEFGILIDE